MMSDPALAAWTVATGLGVGPLIAGRSLRSPSTAEREAPSLRRSLVLGLACALAAAWAMFVHPGAQGVLGALLGWQLLLLAALDARRFWLPLPLTLLLVATGLVAAAAEGSGEFAARTAGAAAGYAALALVSFTYRRLRGRDGLGGGDAFMLAGGGAWLGWTGLPTVLVLASLGGLAAVGLLAAFGRWTGRDQPLPFGVALAAGIWLTWLYGPVGG